MGTFEVCLDWTLFILKGNVGSGKYGCFTLLNAKHHIFSFGQVAPPPNAPPSWYSPICSARTRRGKPPPAITVAEPPLPCFTPNPALFPRVGRRPRNGLRGLSYPTGAVPRADLRAFVLPTSALTLQTPRAGLRLGRSRGHLALGPGFSGGHTSTSYSSPCLFLLLPPVFIIDPDSTNHQSQSRPWVPTMMPPPRPGSCHAQEPRVSLEQGGCDLFMNGAVL